MKDKLSNASILERLGYQIEVVAKVGSIRVFATGPKTINAIANSDGYTDDPLNTVIENQRIPIKPGENGISEGAATCFVGATRKEGIIYLHHSAHNPDPIVFDSESRGIIMGPRSKISSWEKTLKRTGHDVVIPDEEGVDVNIAVVRGKVTIPKVRINLPKGIYINSSLPQGATEKNVPFTIVPAEIQAIRKKR